MVKRLPVRRVSVPVEACTEHQDFPNAKVHLHSIDHLPVGWTSSRAICYQVAALVPRDPSRRLLSFLESSHLIDKFVVYRRVTLIAEEVWDNDDIVVFHRVSISLLDWPNDNPHRWSHKSPLRVDFVSVHLLAFTWVIVLFNEILILMAIVLILLTFHFPSRHEERVLLPRCGVSSSTTPHTS